MKITKFGAFDGAREVWEIEGGPYAIAAYHDGRWHNHAPGRIIGHWRWVDNEELEKTLTTLREEALRHEEW